MTSPDVFPGSSSEPYRFTPDSEIGDEGHRRRPPDQGRSRVQGLDLPSGSAQSQPQRPVTRRVNDEPCPRPPDQGPPQMDDRDPC